jgi:hypothetical protein
MQSVHGIEPDLYSLTSLITACSGSGELERAVKLFEECSPTGKFPHIHPNEALYGALIGLLVTEGMLADAIRIYSKGVDVGIYSSHVHEKEGLSIIGSLTWNTVLGSPQSKDIESSQVQTHRQHDYSITLDLHGLSLPVAKVATCSTLRTMAKENMELGDLLLVTGIGRHGRIPKAIAAKPVDKSSFDSEKLSRLKPSGLLHAEIKAFCSGSFSPSLYSSAFHSAGRPSRKTGNNQGVFTLNAKSIRNWISNGALIQGFSDVGSLRY